MGDAGRMLRVLLPLLALLLLGACTAVGPHVAGTPTHHRTYGFANPNGAGGTTPVEFLLDRARLALAGPEEHPAPALAPAEAQAGWLESGEADALQWLGHATVRIRLAGSVVLVDPVFGAYVTPLPPLGPPRASPPPLRPEELDDVAALLLTHDHYDHFEPASVDAVAMAAGARCLAPLGLAAGEGLDCALTELDWGEGLEVGALRVTLLRAQHESGRGLFDRDRSLWGAWLLEGGGRRVYVMGDSGYGPHFAKVGGPVDLAVINLGGYQPREQNRGVHLDPAEAVQALLDLQARRAVIVHWGTYPLGTERVPEMQADLAAAVAAAGLPAEAVLFLAIGETLRF